MDCCMPEEVLFKSESDQSREEIASFFLGRQDRTRDSLVAFLPIVRVLRHAQVSIRTQIFN